MTAPTTATLLLNCPDTKGIVYHVSQFIFERGGNIVTAQQHREELGDRFFMRVHFDRSDMAADRAAFEAEWRPLAERHSMEWRLAFSEQRRRMAVMVSRYDHCLYDLFLRQQYGELNARIAVVVGNHPDLAPVSKSSRPPSSTSP